MKRFTSSLQKIFNFYYDGFTSMPEWGRRVWVIILVKLFLIFIVLKLFFFPDLLKRDFRNDAERSTHMRDQLLNITTK